MSVLETERLALRELTTTDAKFILRLLNEPSFLQNIGDKGVRNLDDAKQYILSGPVASYRQNKFGLYLVELKDSQTPIGICGLLKRESLGDVDVGFAFLPEFWNKGYAVESALAVMAFGKDVLKLKRIVAITNPDNQGSRRVLEKLGLRFDRVIKLTEEATETWLFVPEETPK